ncbi:tol-pal system-associated acyl-CoA thioesterase [Verrucomicrobiota bacterium]|nr:tol-pal system-associated acyl-CoA thioesterase [Verrucomicrobiota bacterium]
MNPHSAGDGAPETPTIEIEQQVMFFDTDCGGVVHNLAYLRMIETARTMLAEQLGLAMVEMAARGVYPVLLRTEADYRKPAKLSDRLIIRGKMSRMERARFWCEFEVVRPADGTLMVTCQQSLALIKMPEGKPLRLPEDWAVRFAHLRIMK